MKSATIQNEIKKTLSSYKSKIFSLAKRKKDIVNELKKNIESRKIDKIKKDLSI